MKKKFLSVVMLLSILMMVGVTPVMCAENRIICEETVSGNSVCISGYIENATEQYDVTILVGDISNVIYINQIKSEADGTFCFTFPIAKTVASGEYEYKVGSNSDAAVYSGTINYTSGLVKQTDMFIDAELDVNISAYVPSINGTIKSKAGVQTSFNIIDATNQTTIASDTITEDDGAFEISYTLPSLARNTTYSISIICTDAERTVAKAIITIDSSILKISVNGNAEIADGVTINGAMQSVNTGLIDKNTVITQNKSFSGSMLNVAAFVSFHLEAQGVYEHYVESHQPELHGTVRTVTGSAGDLVHVTVGAEQIRSFSNKTFKLEYDPEQIKPVTLSGIKYEDILNLNHIQVISCSDGEIVFRVAQIDIPENKVWQGVIGILGFEFNSDYSGSTTIMLNVDGE